MADGLTRHMEALEAPRKACLRCRRPEVVCYCSKIPRLETRTRVVFLQHPRERKVAIGTARMAHLALPNSEFHQGVHFDEQAWLSHLCDSGKAAVLFPGPGSKTPAELDVLPETLLVLDGTWTLARKLLRENEVLRRFPRIGFTPRRPGNYRIRKEPTPESLATIEAVAEILGELEGRPGAFDAMLEPFDFMVDRQLVHVAQRQGPSRFKRKRNREPRIPAWRRRLQTDFDRLVLVYAEANVWGHCETTWYPAELLHWVAYRPSTGERFEAIAQTQHPLGPNTPFHLEIPQERLLQGRPLPEELARFSDFVRPDDLFVGWGHHGHGLLKDAGGPSRELLELRASVTQLLNSRTQGVEDAADRLKAEPRAIWGLGRAGRRIAALQRVAETLARGP